MKNLFYLLALSFFIFTLPQLATAQAKCQPKACKKASMADKTKADAEPAAYVKIDLKAMAQTQNCKKAGAKAVKVVNDNQSILQACKPDCDPKDCPPVCPPACMEVMKASLDAQKACMEAKKACKENCPPNCCTGEKSEKSSI